MLNKKNKYKHEKKTFREFTPFERESRRQAKKYGNREIGERVAAALFYRKKRSQP